MKIRKLYLDGKEKAFTMSYDDGVKQDIRLVKIMNKYGLVGTFNLNSGMESEEFSWINRGVTIKRMNKDGLPDLYKGHEIAVHTLTHAHLEKMTKEEIEKEIEEDMKNHTAMFGYEVKGMAYPFGTYNDLVLEVLKEKGIVYSRGCDNTFGFEIPKNFLIWKPTCHHNDEKLAEICNNFLNTKEELALFYLWGHSYEFDVNNNWEHIENFAEKISNIDNVWYATNMEIYNYINAMEKLEISGDTVVNNSDMPLWIEKNGEVLKLDPK